MVLDQADCNTRLRSHEGKRYPAIDYLGEEMLSVASEFVHDSRTGMELIYQRDYNVNVQNTHDRVHKKSHGLLHCPHRSEDRNLWLKSL